MSDKALAMLGVTVGSVVGGYLPALWGGSLFSFSSVIFSAVGGLLGLYIAFRLMN